MDPVEPGADIAPRVAPVACRVAMFQPRVKTLQELLRKTTKISKAQVGYHVSSVCPNLFFVIVITRWLHPVLFEQGCTKREKKIYLSMSNIAFRHPLRHFSCIPLPSLIHGSGGPSPAIGTYPLTN